MTHWTRRHPDATDLTVAVASGVLVLFGTLIQRDGDPDAALAAVTLGVAVGAVVLWSLRRRRDRTRRDADALLEQRLGIARELHDVVAHHVSVIGIQAAAARRSLDRSPAETAEALTAIEASSRAAVLEMQRLVTTLRHPDDVADVAAPASRQAPSPPPPMLVDLPALADRMGAAGLAVALTGFDAPDRPHVSAPAEVALYRICQEASTNALRHAGPVPVRISLTRAGGDAILTIENDAPTATRPASVASGGMGIPGMRERVRAVGGTLDAGPTSTGGFAVTACVPLEAA